MDIVILVHVAAIPHYLDVFLSLETDGLLTSTGVDIVGDIVVWEPTPPSDTLGLGRLLHRKHQYFGSLFYIIVLKAFLEVQLGPIAID